MNDSYDMPPGYPSYDAQSDTDHLYENVPFDITVAPGQSCERRHSIGNSKCHSRDLHSPRYSSVGRKDMANRPYLNGVSPKSYSINDLKDLRGSLSPSPEPRNVILNSEDRSRPLQRYYYPCGRTDKTFHIALPADYDINSECRKPQVSRSCPPIPTINVDQFYQWLDDNEFKPQLKSRNLSPAIKSPTLDQWETMKGDKSRLRSVSRASNNSTLSASPPHVGFLTVPRSESPRKRHASGSGSSTSGSWPDLSEFATLPLTQAELELHQVADSLKSIGGSPDPPCNPSERPHGSLSSLNDMQSTYMTVSDGGSYLNLNHLDSMAGSCSNLSDTTASFVTGYESFEPEYYLGRDERPSSGMSGSYANVQTEGYSPEERDTRDEDEADISNLIRTIEMLENRCTMFLEDWLPTPAKAISLENRSPFRTIALVTTGLNASCRYPFGVTVSGGVDCESPVTVSLIEEGSLASQTALQVGDLIWNINGVPVQGLKQQQVLQLLNACAALTPGQKGEVVLIVLPHNNLGCLESSMAEIEALSQSRQLVSVYNSVYRYNKRMSHTSSKLPLNTHKNRYNDIVAYDSTRVKITPNEDNELSDYINANYVNMPISGTPLVNRYIATQGPKSSTVGDFWLMVWEQGCSLIVMLTTLFEGDVIKCYKYWPDQSAPLLLPHFEVRQIMENRSNAWVTRHFVLRNSATNEERQVKHLQYIKWPDHGVPQDSADFVRFAHLVRELRSSAVHEPMIVHCSAGIGRTGVLIMMETAMCHIEQRQPVRPEEMLRSMRDQRPSLVQTDKQFTFVVGAILRVYTEGEVRPLS